MADASKKRDIGWNYGTQGATKDSVNCKFCGSIFNGGITRHKQHLVGGFKNVKQYTACPSEIREEIRAYMQNKIANNPKFQKSKQKGGFEKGGGIDETKKILRERAYRFHQNVQVFENTIERIGPENVVQVVTDNGSENVKAGSRMMGAYPHIYWTPCAAHCINLIFGDIFKLKPYASGNITLISTYHLTFF
ncbi:uncharacterized protein LOC114078004 [Solanum pennellii]|uniref:Uncharacterized protein LOC114078004 n=1 Tax=Solanum pennellii TaxID=28526 RepID=A0ABM1VEY3_SOLPN|nr:uncharacterized protein LOC114078004 [Solanum pennellii]